jgi:hypothetical protein
MGERLLLAYTTLMDKAPGAAFRRARELYLNKYCVPQGNADHPLRLFVCDEQTDESRGPAPDGEPGHRLVTLTSRPGQLAIVHWQQTCPPTPLMLESYLADEWQLNADELDLVGLHQPLVSRWRASNPVQPSGRSVLPTAEPINAQGMKTKTIPYSEPSALYPPLPLKKRSPSPL